MPAGRDVGRRTPGSAVDGRTVSTLDLFGDRLTVLTGAYADPDPGGAARAVPGGSGASFG